MLPASDVQGCLRRASRLLHLNVLAAFTHLA
ncbi:MAG TPA: hypothetical protein DEF41_14310 [Desulfovibrio sp.]|uniref:Uncharacterized protein n=1 Tax=Nitratidesulfovibrio vulgaris (strain ATCC 29579 / DSM 644 / CCUG 34227 / NCIMB 8303 / VKM B-1760 / Hildenborough) TaxID=882 RepID=Q729J2_NITV2|nr:hypothetical protein DVU_2358 [Nitratidesulfovibrio vulgaris str. Hildenborough]HBW17256.1 hypothetical protein [Desulfovibrio sp.]